MAQSTFYSLLTTALDIRGVLDSIANINSLTFLSLLLNSSRKPITLLFDAVV
jgi:hypothetical protein